MTRRFPIDEQVAEGLLNLLGHASRSMSRERDWDRDEAPDQRPASREDRDEGRGQEDVESASSRLVDLLRDAARGRRGREPAPLTSPPRVRPVRRAAVELPLPDEASPSASPGPAGDSPADPWSTQWRCALALPEAPEEIRQVIRWIRSDLASKGEESSASGT